MLSSYDLPDGLSMPSSILLYQEDEGAPGGAAAATMDVRYLVDETDMAKELSAKQGGGGDEGPVTVRLTRDAITEILRFHPDDGLRWQVSEMVS